MKAKDTINRKNESNLWKKVPNSIYLTARYKGKSSLLLKVLLNIKSTVDTIKIKNNPEIIQEYSAIFLNLFGSDKYDGIKYRYPSPIKANKLENP